MPTGSLSTADYAAVINDLRAKREELDRTIAFLESLNGLASTPTSPSAPASPRVRQDAAPRERFETAPPSELANLGQADACVWLLRKAGAPMTTRQIADGLAEAGYKTNATDPINNVSACLHHRAKGKGDVVRDGKVWRLVANKPVHISTSAALLNGTGYAADA